MTKLRVGEVKASTVKCSGSEGAGVGPPTWSTGRSFCAAKVRASAAVSPFRSYRPPIGPMAVIAAHAALEGPSGFSLALMSTAPGGGGVKSCPCSARPEGPGGAAAAMAKCASVRIGAAATSAAPLEEAAAGAQRGG